MTLPAWVGGQAPAYTGSSTTSTTLTSVPAGSSIVVVSSGESTGQTPTIADSIVGGYTLVGRWTAHDSLGHGGSGGDTGITVYVYRNHPGGSPVITVSSAYIDNGMNAFWIADSLDATTPFGTPVTLAQSASSNSDATTITPTADSYVMSFWAVDYTNVGPVTAFSDDLMHNQSDHYSAEGAVDSVVTAGTPKTVTWTTTSASPGALVVTVPFTKASSGSSGSGVATLSLLAAGTSAMKATATGLATLALLASGTSLNSSSATGSGAATIALTAAGTSVIHASGSGTAALVLQASGTAGVATIGRYYIPVTIDHTLVAADLTDYTVRVIGTIASLKSTAHGGHVAESHGYDIVPCANIDGSGIFAYYLNAWDPTTGFISLVFRKSSLSSSVDTTFYIRSGNASATNGSVSASVFDSGTSLAWDGGDGTTRSGADLTGHGHTASFVEEISGQTINAVLTPIGGGVDLGENTPDPVNFYTQSLTVPITGTEDFLFGPMSGCVVWVARNGVGLDTRGRVLVECVGWTSDGGFYLGEVELRSDSANTSQWLVNIENNPSDLGGRGATVESEYPYAHTVPPGTLVYSAQDYNPTAMTVTMHISHFDGSGVFRYTKYVTSLTHLRGTDSLPTNLTFGNSITGRSNTDGYLTNVRIHTVSRGDAWFQTEANNLVRPASFFTFGSETDTSGSASGSGTATLTLLASGTSVVATSGSGTATLVLLASGTSVNASISASGAATLTLFAAGTGGPPLAPEAVPNLAQVPHLSVWTDLACAGGTPLIHVEYVSCLYGQALDNTEVCTVVVERENIPLLSTIATGNVFRVDNELGETYEYVIGNQQDDRNSPVATITANPVEFLLNRVLVTDRNATRPSTAISGTNTISDWVTLYILESLALRNQIWWSLGTIDPDVSPSLQLVDKNCMYMTRQLLQNQTASLRARRLGETGYAYDLVDIVVATSPVAFVGRNVTALTREIDWKEQANAIVPAGRTFSGNDEPERCWWVPFRAAVSGAVLTLDDPAGLGTTILASDDQVSVPNMAWRLGTIPVPLTPYSTFLTPIYRVLYLSGTAKLWMVGGGQLRSYDLASQTFGTALTTSLSNARDLYYYSSTDTLYVCDSSVIVPYAASTGIAGTTITISFGRRFAWVPTLNILLVGTDGATTLKQFSPSSNTVTATGPTMVTPGHLGVVSATQVYVASDSQDDLYRYNPTANTTTTTLTGSAGGGTTGYAALCYLPALSQAWCFARNGSIVVVSTTTDTVVRVSSAVGVHGVVQDAQLINGNLVGVTDDGLLVTYDGTSGALLSVQQHLAWATSTTSGTVNLRSVNPCLDYDCLLVGTSYSTVMAMDAQTAGASVARAITAASAATPSVTLAHGAFPVATTGEVAFTRDDGMPLETIPNASSVATYGPIDRAVIASQLSGGSDRVLNGDLTWFDSSRKAARFLNLTQLNGTTESKWDGYDDNTVTSFSTVVNGGQSYTVGTPFGLVLKSAGAGRVFLPGDVLLDAGVFAFGVLARSVADGSGNVTVYGRTYTSGTTVADLTPLTGLRPNGLTLVTESPTWLVLPIVGNASTAQTSHVFADVAVPFIPGEMANLFWGMEAYLWSGLGIPPNVIHLKIQGLDGANTVVDVFPNPDTGLYGPAILTPMTYTNVQPLPMHTAGGHLRFSVYFDSASGTNYYGGLYLKRLWVQVGNADRGPPDDGAPRLWQLGQDEAVDRGDPAVTYTVQVVEDDPTAPFELGATVDLRDPDRGVFASPRIVAVVRSLPKTIDEVVLPQLTLDNRAPSFVRYVVTSGDTG